MARGAPHFRGSPYDTAMYSTDGKELPALLSPPAPHTATDDLVQTCSSPVAQEVRDSLPRNWVDVAWRTAPLEVLRN